MHNKTMSYNSHKRLFLVDKSAGRGLGRAKSARKVSGRIARKHWIGVKIITSTRYLPLIPTRDMHNVIFADSSFSLALTGATEGVRPDSISVSSGNRYFMHIAKYAVKDQSMGVILL